MIVTVNSGTVNSGTINYYVLNIIHQKFSLIKSQFPSKGHEGELGEGQGCMYIMRILYTLQGTSSVHFLNELFPIKTKSNYQMNI